MTEPRDIIIKPVISEKSYTMVDSGKYTFRVASGANKVQIRQAVESIFGVVVTDVNTMKVQGKRRVRGTKGGGRVSGRLPNWKKAVVSLRAGDKIEIFKGI